MSLKLTFDKLPTYITRSKPRPPYFEPLFNSLFNPRCVIKIAITAIVSPAKLETYFPEYPEKIEKSERPNDVQIFIERSTTNGQTVNRGESFPAGYSRGYV